MSSSGLRTAITFLDILIAIGKYMFPVTVAFILFSGAAALNTAATGNTAGTIFWIVLASLEAWFALKFMTGKKDHRRLEYRRSESRTTFTDASQA